MSAELPGSLRDEIFRIAEETYGVQPEFLWEDAPLHGVLRRPDNRKWFGIVMRIRYRNLGLPSEEPVDVLNLKCGPLLLGSLLPQEGFFPAWHMQKTAWVSILLDGTVPPEEIAPLLEISWDMTANKTRKKRRPPEE